MCDEIHSEETYLPDAQYSFSRSVTVLFNGKKYQIVWSFHLIFNFWCNWPTYR